ncbi:hypothetical protein LTR15_002121 [Elasticomyces elasticus]|nr:hypothetical protein LTR15_002121 [Elasticomyces elasticus]
MVRKRFHGLKRPRIRQDSSKETLYNLSRLITPGAANRTFFQQKWTAKSMARAYHNPYVREGQWTRMFDRRLPAVVSMSHQYLAKYDGSEMALGRGSGLEVDGRRNNGRGEDRDEDEGGMEGESQVLRKRDGRVEKTPYMHMTFHPLERRLDTAIWRALFSSSTKQARQFVVHGWVKVNGKKMVYPGYQLNPGDMFSVDPERVMFATGARKSKKGSPVSDQEAEDRRVERNAAKSREAAAYNSEVEEGLEELEEDEDSDTGAATLESDEDREALTTKPEDEQDARKAMKNLVLRAKRILEDSKRKLSGKRQQELRSFAQSVRKTMAKHRPIDAVLAEGSSSETNSISDFETALAEIMTKIPSDSLPTLSTSATQLATTASASQAPTEDKPDEYNAAKDAALLASALERARENPIDVSKPYATPWQPRAFMSAFAFIPRYLEVNQNVCSAVYLRHPVARPGLAEVPTPFGGEVMGLAFNWYLRRR